MQEPNKRWDAPRLASQSKSSFFDGGGTFPLPSLFFSSILYYFSCPRMSQIQMKRYVEIVWLVEWLFISCLVFTKIPINWKWPEANISGPVAKPGIATGSYFSQILWGNEKLVGREFKSRLARHSWLLFQLNQFLLAYYWNMHCIHFNEHNLVIPILELQ